MTVEDLSHDDEGRWDDFVNQNPNALPHHLLGWRTVFQKTYGFRPRYLVAKNGASIVGVMPLFEIRSRIQGHHFSTLPGGVCADTETAGLALLERAKELTISQNARFLAIRDSRQFWEAGLATDSSQCAVSIALRDGIDSLEKRLDRNLRRQLRKAEENGLVARNDINQLDPFFSMFAVFLKSVGTPIFKKQLLLTALAVFPNNFWLQGLWYDGKMIGGGIQFHMRNTHFGIWGASLHQYLNLCPNHLRYWRLIQDGCQNGSQTLDMGRSATGSGQARFKLLWPAAAATPVYQQFYLHRTKNMPMGAVEATEGKGQLAIRLWQRLPLPITILLGPRIRAHLPFA